MGPCGRARALGRTRIGLVTRAPARLPLDRHPRRAGADRAGRARAWAARPEPDDLPDDLRRRDCARPMAGGAGRARARRALAAAPEADLRRADRHRPEADAPRPAGDDRRGGRRARAAARRERGYRGDLAALSARIDASRAPLRRRTARRNPGAAGSRLTEVQAGSRAEGMEMRGSPPGCLSRGVARSVATLLL